MNVKQAADVIRSKQRFVVGGYQRLDGDAVGSSLAVYHLLRQLGKDAVIAHLDTIPTHYRFLKGADTAHANYSNVPLDRDCFITVDTPDVKREDLLGGHFPNDIFVLNIDHHGSNYMYGDVNWIDAKAAAVGEMIADLIDELGANITPEIAAPLYVSIVTDTGRFGFDATTERTHKLAARLHQAGIDLQTITREVYQSKLLGEFKLMGRAAEALRLECDNRIGLIRLTEEDIAACNFQPEESQAFAEIGLNIKGVVMSIFARPAKKGGTKFSLRSKSDAVNVNTLASKFGGGGHAKAAGLVIDEPGEAACAKLLAEADAYVRAQLG